MGSKNRSVVRERMNTVSRKRLYKANGHWAVATTGTVALAATGVLGAVSTAHADTVVPTESTQQVVSIPQEVVNTNVSTNAEVAPVVASANTTVNQAVQTAQPQVSVAGGNLASTALQVVSQGNVDQVLQDANQQAMNVSAVGSADGVMNAAIQSGSAATKSMGGSYVATSAEDASSMTIDQIQSFGQSEATQLSAVGAGNAEQLSAANANGQLISNASGVMAPGKTMDVSKLTPAQIASMTSRAAAVLSATGSADSQLVSASNQYTSDINAVGGQLKRSSAINTADNMTPEEIRSSVLSQIVGISQTASADALIKSAVGSALPQVNANSGKMSAGSAIDASKLDLSVIASMVAQQSTMVSATASGDTAILNARQRNQGSIKAAGGQLVAGSHVNTADNMTVDQIQSIVVSQVANISATGKVDESVAVALSNASQAAKALGVDLLSGKNIDVSSMTPDQIQQLGQSLVSNLSMVAQHDQMIESAVPAVSEVVSAAGGRMTPGSVIDTTDWTLDQIASEEAQQSAMISATGSADADVNQHADSATNDITAVGGTIKQSGTVNTADNMTVSEVASDVAKQDARISQTASADRQIGKIVLDNASAISGANGIEKPGSAIDTTDLTPEQVDSLVKNQEAMVSATGSADADVQSHANSASSDITAVGGTIKQSGTVNTADNMTVSEVASDVAKQDARISQTASADRQIGKVVSDTASAISGANGVEKPGSAIDTTDLTPEQVDSLVENQEAMVSATGSADADVQSHADSASADITAVGGTITQSGTVNTADNMTVSEVASDVAKQDARISQTASADRQIGKVVLDNASVISDANGVEKPGKAINATNLTPEQVDSLVKNQEAMVSATGSADADVQSHANSASSDITVVGGTIKQSGTVNTADNMTVSEVASDVAKQDARISQTALADRQIGKVVSDNASAISDADGVEKPGKAIDTTDLTPEQVDSLVKNQEAMVSATGSADAQIKSDADSAAGDIIKVGGTISQSGTVNTADNMTVSEVASDVVKQSSRISQTASADRGIDKVVTDNASVISAVSGVERPGKAIDTTNMTSEQVDSMVKHQEAMVSATGSADAEIKSDVDSATGDITKIGGTVKQSGTVNTADNMTLEEVASDVAKQSARISETVSADRGIEGVVSTSSAAISAIGGITKPGKDIDTTDLTSDVIASMVSHQEAMVSATASADTVLKSMVDGISDAVKSNAGFVKASGSVNTADNMTVDQIKSAVDVQLGRLSAVNAVDQSLADMIKNGSGTIFGGNVKPGSAIDVSDKTGSQIMAMGQSQAALVSQVISNNVMLSNAEASAASIVARVGGKVSKGFPIDVTGKTVAEIASLAKAQAAVLDAVADVDDQLNVALQNKNAITKVGGTLTRGADINAASMSPDAIRKAGKKQVANLSATASGDAMIQNAVNDVWSETATRGSATDVSQMTPDQIASLTASEVDVLGETQNANEQLSQAVKQTSESIHRIGGKTIAVPTRDTTKLSSDEIGSSAASQTGKLAETATADDLISTAVSQHNGVVMSSIAAVNTTKMASQDIVSEVHSQTNHISHTDSMQSTVSNQVATQLNKVTTAGGQITKSGIFNTTSMTEDDMTSWTGSENAHLEHVGSNDAVLTSTINVQHNGLVILGGSAVSQAAIDVTSMTDAEIDSLMQSQATLISQAASANLQMKSMYDSAKAEGAIMTSNQTSLSNKTAIDSLLTSTTSALSSAVTVAKTSKMVSSAVDSFNTAMSAVVAQYKQAGGNPLDIKMVTINPGVDAATVSATASSALASLSAENSTVESQMSVATETMNYITNNVPDMIKKLGSEAEATSGLTYSQASTVQVHSLGDVKSDWDNQKSSASVIIANRQKYNSVVASFNPSKQSGVGHDALIAAVQQAKSLGVKVTVDGPVDKGEVDPLDSHQVSSMAAVIDGDYSAQASAVQAAIALQKEYNDQLQRQKDISAKEQKEMQAIQDSAKVAPSRYASNIKAWGLSNHSMYWNDFVGDWVDTGLDGNIGNHGDNFGFSFDVDISNLKKGNVIDILHVKTTSDAPGYSPVSQVYDGLINTEGVPVVIKGVTYGHLYAKHSNNIVNGWGDGSLDVYMALDQDVPGVGRQSFTFDHLGSNCWNYTNRPGGFDGKDVTTLHIAVIPADPSINTEVTSQNIYIHKVHNTEATDWPSDTVEQHAQAWQYWDRAQMRTLQLTGRKVPRNVFEEWSNSVGQKMSMFKDQPYYFVNRKISNSTGFASYNGQSSIHGESAIQAEVDAFDSNGKALNTFDWNSTANKPSGDPDAPSENRSTKAPDGLNVQQLQSYALNHLDDMNVLPHRKAEGWTWYSMQSDGSFIAVSYFTKQSLQEALQFKMKSANDYKSASFNIQADPNPEQAYQNTIKSLNGINDGMALWQSIATLSFDYGDPSVANTVHDQLLDNDGSVIWDGTVTSQPPVQMHSGQSGLRVHYINGSNGNQMRQMNISVGDAGSTVKVQPKEIPGYWLKTDGATHIPSGTIIESDTDETYPSQQGTWKDVYVVYVPYLENGAAHVSYHSNTTKVKPVQSHLTLHSYVDNDRFAPVMAKSGAISPKMTVTSADPIYKALSTKIPDVKTNYHAYDTNLIDHFNYQYSPLSTQYHVYNDEGGYNPEDFNYSPVGSTYDRYDTDGTNIPPMIEDPKNPGHLIPNPKFTGYTPWSTTWKNYSTDGTNIPPMIEDPKNPGYLIPNPKFTGYTPWSTTWKNYSTDGTNIPPMIPDPKNPGHLIPNPKFSGYTPWSTTWKNYSTDGTNIPPMIEDPKNPGHLIPNPKFSGYTPWSTTWKNYSTDGTNIPPMIEDPKNPGHLIPNPKFSGYTPWSTTWKNYSTDGTNIPPMIEDPKNPGHLIPNPKFSGYTPWSTTWKNYSTDGTNIPPMIEDPKNPGHLIPNPKFSGYTPWSTTWKNYSSDGRAISKTVPPVIPDPNNPGKFIKNPKFTGYAPMTAQKRALDTKYVVLDSDGSHIPPVIPDPNHPGKLIPNPKFTGYAPFSYTYSPYSDDGTKVPSMIPDGHGGLMPNPRFTGYAPLSTTYTPLSTTYHNYVAAPEKVPATPQPFKPAPAPAPTVATVVAPAPLAPQSAPALPQTGHQDNSYLALIGLATLASVSVLSMIGLRKKNELD